MKESINNNIKNMNIAFNNPEGNALIGERDYHSEKLLNQALNLYDEHEELKEEGFDLLETSDPLVQKQGRIGMVDAIGDLVVFLVGLSVYINRYYEINEDVVFDVPEENKDSHDMIKHSIDNVILSIKGKRDIDFVEIEMNNLMNLLYSFCKSRNIDIEEVINRVTKSNMSKLCKTKEQLDNTVKFYRDLGVDIYIKESPVNQDDGSYQYIVYSACEQTVKGKVYRANKFLKCIDWFEPNLEGL